ncbi:hypothetical protein NMYAN_20240 [Nitrosomonas nitrosa]|uniref:Uncharacterized protein n=1 Tax=Nitrosomonas nitrosa TaxID=52442 RepID=A0A8H8YZ56_9PROT|nr:hypothetical protein NMYAN_20240 [Nitrosomonas nitrosa]
MLDAGQLSKLPVRQRTKTKEQYSRSRFSKLPVRQRTRISKIFTVL